MDSSNSGSATFEGMIAFTLGFLREFNLGADKTQFSVITNGRNNKPVINFDFRQGRNKETVERQLYGLVGSQGGPRLDMSLDVAQLDVFTAERGARADVKKLVVLLTDGFFGDKLSAAIVTDQLRAQGIELLIIGVGPRAQVDVYDLDTLAGTKSSTQLVNLEELTSHKFVRKMYMAAGDVGKSFLHFPDHPYTFK